MKTICLVATACLTCAFTCSSPMATSSPAEARSELDTNLVTRRNLYITSRRSDKLLVVYPATKDKQYLPLLQRLQERLTDQQFTLTIQADTATIQTDLSQQPSLLIGALDSHRFLRDWLNKTPFATQEAGFVIGEDRYTDPHTLFKLFFFPNPERPHIPLHFITGTSDAAVLDHIRQQYDEDIRRLIWTNWGYELHQQGEVKILGNLADTTWQLDKRIHYQFDDKWDTLAVSKHFTFLGHPSVMEPAALRDLQQSREALVTSVLQFTNKKTLGTPFAYHLFPTIERKGLQQQNTYPAHFDLETRKLYMVARPEYQAQCQVEENRLLLRHLLGTSQNLALEYGLSLYFTKIWGQHDYNFWTARLYHSNNLPPLSELLDNDLFARESELVFKPMAATFIGFLLEHWGKDSFLRQYGTWQAKPSIVAELLPAWEAYLQRTYPEAPTIVNNSRALVYQRGFNFAHEGYRIYNGYGSTLSDQSLQKLKLIGTNAVAIVPYSGQRSSSTPAFIPLSQHPGSETDESVISTRLQASALGMMTMLKPQIWYGRSWPGDVRMNSEEDWELFFDYYYRWIRHYSILAEMHEFDIFCLGVEFVQTTLQKPEHWRAIIKKIRGLYSGKLTYAANWGEEFEQLSFWEDLDYIGLNCYYPLSTSARVSKAELKKAFAKELAKAEKISKRHQRPLLFTEIGFRSIVSPWRQPHAEPGDHDFNAEHQALCYDVVLESIAEKDWVHGIYWWKWPSNLDHVGYQNRGFTPNRKLGEEVVEKWFTKK